ncbi:hypothetical protein GWK48_02605 [Metallosphaera tengchongensis]|uniref:DUF4352 domain-containing protein n=1 Tax=Metallosphaera tengchongensis TaxID=1532350 RepID=A0A6N0NU36_9CREN|nr:hypothetical protein [Metallosphaera tengchongensis]QKQ98987.1 hypothetical protein GWK48_02605 [Metallosphaera tengchongensis]
MRRYLKSKRAISGAVTALILVIVSVALALAVAVFAFGLFGTFGSSGQVQAISTPIVNVTGTNGMAPYKITVTVDIKNSGTTQASITSISVGDITNTSPELYYNGKLQSNIPGGFDGPLSIVIYSNNLPGTLTPTNIGGSVPITIILSEGSLSPTLTLQGVLNATVK